MEHILNKPIESRRAYAQRRQTLALAIIMSLAVAVALSVVLLS